VSGAPSCAAALTAAFARAGDPGSRREWRRHPDRTAVFITRGTRLIEGRGWQAIDLTRAVERRCNAHQADRSESPEPVPLVGMVGKARVESVRALARW
jgi:hypothetical protein